MLLTGAVLLVPVWSSMPALADAPQAVTEFLPKGQVQPVHDPSVIEADGQYYLYSTGSAATGEAVRVLRSDDLITWELLPSIFPEVPDWVQSAYGSSVRTLWAPDVVRIGTQYHLYYTASRFGTNNSAIGMAVTKSLDPASKEYGWKDLGKVIASSSDANDYNAIDPNVVQDQAGKLWLIFGSYWSGLKIVELDAKTGMLKDPASPSIQAIASDPKPPHAEEGAALMWHDGWYHLFFSKGTCCQGVRSTYYIVSGRSREITGPYVDRDGKQLLDGGGTPVLKSYYPVFGPGHNSVFKAMGREWIVHHFYDPHKHWNRDVWGMPTLQVRPIVWDADGWPLPGESWSGPVAEVASPNVVGKWFFSVDFSDWEPTDIFADGTVRAPRHTGTWSRQEHRLSFVWPDPTAPGGAWTDTALLSPDGSTFVGRNQAGMIVRGRKADEQSANPNGNLHQSAH